MALKMVSALNQLPPPARSVSDTVSAAKRKAEFDKLIKELKRAEPDITKGDKLKLQAVASINKFLDTRPRGDRDRNLTLIASALGKNVRTLYRWISEVADPEGADKKLEERRAATSKIPLDTRELLVKALNEHLAATQGDIESVLTVIRNSPINRAELCTMCKDMADVK